MRLSRGGKTVGAIAVALALLGPAGVAGAQAPPYVVEGGLTQPIHPFAEAIEQRLFVETPLDTDGDGRLDRVRIDLSRPGATAQGLKVPVILEASPYRSNVWGAAPYHTDLDPEALPQSGTRHRSEAASAEGGRGPAPDLPGALDNYYVPRGYAVVLAQSVGTGQSDGCPTVGDDAETQSAKAIIDWLNGRARAFDEAGNAVSADWATGDVGMIGGSYNGTIPNQVATTGVEGLKTIVPIVAISDWYSYYRENGLVVAPGGYQGEDADVLFAYITGRDRALGHCAAQYAAMTEAQDRTTGDDNDFWKARDHRKGARSITASVFVVDGRNDWNVKPSQWGMWWEELTRFDVTRKIWLHNGGHSTPGNAARYTLPDGTSWTYQQTVHRWFDSELLGIDNGIHDEPRAIIQREDGANTTAPDWPVPGAQDVVLRLTAESASAPGGLSPLPVAPPKQAQQSFTDTGRTVRSTVLIRDPDAFTGQRLVYRSSPLEQAVQLSGTPSIRLRAAVDNASAANLTAYLVDYGPPGSTAAPVMVTRGWMDVQNRVRRDKTDPIKQGQFYDFRWDLHPDDYVFAAGRRIGVVVMSTDYDFTLRPAPGTQLSVLPGFSSVTLPLVGGVPAGL